MDRKYDIIELQKMSIVELTSICDQSKIGIQNNFKQSLIYAILDKQCETVIAPSESNSRDRYAVADTIIKAKILIVVIFLSFSNMSAEASLKYKIRRHFNRIEQADQHQNCKASCKDPYRMERNWERRPRSYSIIPQIKIRRCRIM